MSDDMECPTPCICGRIVELDEMCSIDGKLPDGGNLVCIDCHCVECDGNGECDKCSGCKQCDYCGAGCDKCYESGKCQKCDGLGYVIAKQPH